MKIHILANTHRAASDIMQGVPRQHWHYINHVNDLRGLQRPLILQLPQAWMNREHTELKAYCDIKGWHIADTSDTIEKLLREHNWEYAQEHDQFAYARGVDSETRIIRYFSQQRPAS